MQVLTQMLERAINMPNIANDIFKKAVKENEKAILDLNREQMYEHGIVDVNKPTQSLQYSNLTKQFKTGAVAGRKPAKYPRIDHITLKWDGTFHKSLKVKFLDNYFIIWSSDPTWVFDLELQTRFENALGLTVGSIDKLVDLFIPTFQKSTLSYLLTGKI